MFFPADQMRQVYHALRAQRRCVGCAQPLTTPHVRCAPCRQRRAAAQARYRIRQMMQEGQ